MVPHFILRFIFKEAKEESLVISGINVTGYNIYIVPYTVCGGGGVGGGTRSCTASRYSCINVSIS
jgi:hypothetical protein